MTTKQTIVQELGEDVILAPNRIAGSLIANDQAKYYFALLQTARAQADQPNGTMSDLKAERLACQIGEAWLDDVVSGARKERAGYHVPHGAEILERIRAAITAMLVCLAASEREELASRMKAVLDALSLPDDDLIPGALISAITSGDRKAGDSLHLVVMDAHRAINRLQSETAQSVVDGAKVHHVSEKGARRVKAFMQGLNRTAPLKFDHPGLGTTATEHDGLLLIQNDIGVTDAHVLVIRVEKLTVSVTYTDIHRPRLDFFLHMLSDHGVVWSETEDRGSERLEEGRYILASGRFDAADEDALLHFLDRLGSRIVFLIDWNRMRKRLKLFVDKKQAVLLLKWAADNDYGHRGLLEIGGEEALADAVEYAAGSQLRYGVRLDQMIDADRAAAFIKDGLRLACVGLRAGRSRRSIKDELKARLRAAFETERLKVIDLAADHAAIGFDLASSVVEALGPSGRGQGQGWLNRLTMRAGKWEREADQLLNDARDDIRRFDRPASLLTFFERADDAVDELEEACVLVELASVAGVGAPILVQVRALAELALSGARELARSIECAATITRSDIRDDLDEFMGALEKIVAIEHAADSSLRQLRRDLVESRAEGRQLMVLRELAQAIETATDAYAHAAQALRAYLMEEVIA